MSGDPDRPAHAPGPTPRDGGGRRPGGGGGPDRDESRDERLDRNLTELLNELRVALPGVQVLFAFLLVAPFNQGFQRVTDFERKLYFATLMCTMVASILLIAPSMHHRIVFRQHDKGFIVYTANRLTLIGLSVLAVAMTCAVLLVTHVLFGGVMGGITAGVAVLLFAVIWYALPIRQLLVRRPR